MVVRRRPSRGGKERSRIRKLSLGKFLELDSVHGPPRATKLPTSFQIIAILSTLRQAQAGPVPLARATITGKGTCTDAIRETAFSRGDDSRSRHSARICCNGGKTMLHTVEGIFRNGKVDLLETPSNVHEARVIVTFLPASLGPGSGTSFTSEEVDDLRGELAAWDKDWNAPGMEAYDDYETRRCGNLS